MSPDNPNSLIKRCLQNGQFTLDLQAAPSAGIKSLLQEFFPDQALKLKNTTLPDPKAAVVTGTLTGRIFHLDQPQVRIEFKQVSGQLEMQCEFLKFREADWRLDHSFPQLENSLVSGLIFHDPRLILDSERASVLPDDFPRLTARSPGAPETSQANLKGLSFSGEILKAEVPQNMRWLILEDKETTLLLQGPIEDPLTAPNMLLQSAKPKVLSALKKDFPVYLQLYAVSSVAAAGKQSAPEIYGRLKSTLNFKLKKETVDLEFLARFSSWNFLFLQLDCQSGSGITLSDVAELMGIDDIEPNLPSLFPKPSEVKLNGFGLSFNLPQKKLLQAHLTLGMDHTWNLVSDLATLQDMHLTVSLQSPFTSIPQISIFGSIEIEKNRIDGRVDFPDLNYDFRLSPETSFNLTETIGKHLTNSIDLPEIKCTDLILSGDLKEKRYSLFTRLEDNLKFDWGHKSFALSAVELTANVNSRPQGRLVCEFKLGETVLFVSAEDTGGSTGWIFQGGTWGYQEIKIRPLFDSLAEQFGEIELPDALDGLIINRILCEINTAQKEFRFELSTQMPLGTSDAPQAKQNELDTVVQVSIKDNQGNYAKEISGHFVIGTRQFDLRFDSDQKTTDLLAVYRNDQGDKVSLQELVTPLSEELAALVPESLEVTLNDIYLLMSKATSGNRYLFGLDLGADFSLSNLPLVGKQFPEDQNIGVEDLQLIIASAAFSSLDISGFNELLPDGVKKLPVIVPDTDSQQKTDQSNGLNKGLNLSAVMQIGESSQQLMFPVTASEPPPGIKPEDQSSPAVSVQKDPTKWFVVNKSFGPVHFSRIGVNFVDKTLSFALDAAISLGGLTLSLDGLSMGSPLDHFVPEFGLKGLGLDFANGPLEIGGEFLRQKVNGIDEYDGLAIIKTEELTLTAIGSYCEYQGHPSLFLYAVLDYPLGGPSFFFVTGLTAGFGYNRTIKNPDIKTLNQFPLIAAAVNSSASPATSEGSDISQSIQSQLSSLHNWIPPSVGDYFLAVGLKFTSFKMIDSIAVLVVQFGKHDFELDLLGLSTMIVPTPIPGEPPVTPIAEVQLAVKASFIPSEGFLGVQAELTKNSYILSKRCHLTGGFAFFCWFSQSHAGEFVMTLGGYHPAFIRPTYYPVVPRLGLNWQVTSELSIKGTIYYALTSNALMAGGSFSATYQDGGLKAWFNASADFLIAWKPYHYDARVSVDMGVKYKFISVDVGADIHLWGPDFAGTAHISLWIISFDVSFGSTAPPHALPITWSAFKSSFIARDENGIDQVCTLKVQNGLIKELEVTGTDQQKEKRWIINPKDLTITTDSVIPSKKTPHGMGTANTAFGIGPMALPASNVDSEQSVEISILSTDSHGKEVWDPINDEFVFEPLYKNVPSAMWGEKLIPETNGPRLVNDVLAGFRVTPSLKLKPCKSHPINKKELQYDTWEQNHAFSWVDYQPKTDTLSHAEREAVIQKSVQDSHVQQTRNQILASIFGEHEPNIDLSSFNVSDFNTAPQIEHFV